MLNLPNAMTVAMVLLVPTLPVQLPSSADKTPASVTGQVYGTVLDPRDVVIPDVEIHFINRSVDVFSTSSKLGAYKLTLAPGTYSVICYLKGFVVFRRAPIRVGSGVSIMVNLYPDQAADSYGDKRPSDPSYIGDFGPSSERGESSLLVQYKWKVSGTDYIEFRDSIVSFDTYLLVAERARYFRLSGLIQAWNVMLDDGASRTRVGYCELVLPSAIGAPATVRFPYGRAEQARATERAQPRLTDAFTAVARAR